MPYGCGEQNMASWAPNIYVLQYLTSTGQSTSEIEKEAKNFMSVGKLFKKLNTCSRGYNMGTSSGAYEINHEWAYTHQIEYP